MSGILWVALGRKHERSMGGINPHCPPMETLSLPHGFPQTGFEFFSPRMGNALSPHWCFRGIPMLKPSIPGTPLPQIWEPLSQSLRFPGTSTIAPLKPRDPNLPPITHPAPSSPLSLFHHDVPIMPVPILYPWGPLDPNSLCTASSRATCPCRYGRCTVAR